MSLTAEQRATIIAEARSWLGTPYVGWSRVKGPKGGTDCGQFLAGVLINTKHLPADLDLPRYYSLQVAQHKESAEYINKIREYMREIPESEVQAGDNVVYKLGLAFAHAAIIELWPQHVIHAFGGHGVSGSHGTTNPRFKKKERVFFTLLDEYCVEIK